MDPPVTAGQTSFSELVVSHILYSKRLDLQPAGDRQVVRRLQSFGKDRPPRASPEKHLGNLLVPAVRENILTRRH